MGLCKAGGMVLRRGRRRGGGKGPKGNDSWKWAAKVMLLKSSLS